MRIAAIADVHGNLGALEAVLKDLKRHGADAVVNLGDLVSGAMEPVECAALLMELGVPTVRGNHDRQISTVKLEAMGPSDRFAAERLTARQSAWLGSLHTSLLLTEDVFLCHGTPGSDMVYFLEEVDGRGASLATEATIEERAGECSTGLILCGHSHIPRLVRLGDGRTIVNPGSVGLQAYEAEKPYPHRMQNGSPHARYAVIDQTSDGWEAEFVCVAYGWEAEAKVAEANGRADWARALRTGRS